MEAVEGEKDLLMSFTDLLRSPKPIVLPDETLFGAITHFLSTLKDIELKDFISTLIDSPSLLSNTDRSRGFEEAVRLSVLSKLALLDKELKKAYFPEYRKNKRAGQWMDALHGIIKEVPISPGRSNVLIGLVKGMRDATSIKWGNSKDNMEHELVYEAAATQGQKDGLYTTCSALLYVSEDTLWPLRLNEILPSLGAELQLGAESHLQETEFVARALGRLYTIMDKKSKYRHQAWNAMKAFCSNQEYSATRRTLNIERSAFLTVTQSIVDILISSEPPASLSTGDDKHPSAEIATQILITLFLYNEASSLALNDDPAYNHVFWGCLDVLEAKGGQAGYTELIYNLDRLNTYPTKPSVAAFILIIGEQGIQLLGAEVVRDVLLPLCQDFLREPEHPDSFEAAHEFMIALIKAFNNADEGSTAQRPFMSELVPSYARLLLRQLLDDDVKADQFRAVYPIVADGGIHCSEAILRACIQLLEDRLSQVKIDDPKAQTLRLARINMAPLIGRSELKPYLDSLAKTILDQSIGEADRMELLEALFSMIVKSLPDDTKGIGMKWWLKWRTVLEDGVSSHAERARL